MVIQNPNIYTKEQGVLQMGSRRDAYIEAHSLEFDLGHSDCKDCYKKHLECLYYYGECRNEVLED